MNDLLRERLISLLSDPTPVTNKEIQIAYGGFVEELRTVSESEGNYPELFRMLNSTRIELIALQTLHRYEQGEKCA